MMPTGESGIVPSQSLRCAICSTATYRVTSAPIRSIRASSIESAIYVVPRMKITAPSTNPTTTPARKCFCWSVISILLREKKRRLAQVFSPSSDGGGQNSTINLSLSSFSFDARYLLFAQIDYGKLEWEMRNGGVGHLGI